MLLTVLIGSLASFAVGRMRLSKGALLTNAALLTYAIPASFLIVPFTGSCTATGSWTAFGLLLPRRWRSPHRLPS